MSSGNAQARTDKERPRYALNINTDGYHHPSPFMPPTSPLCESGGGGPKNPKHNATVQRNAKTANEHMSLTAKKGDGACRVDEERKWPSRRPQSTPPARLCPDSGEGAQKPSSPLPRTTSPVAPSRKDTGDQVAK
ncbi:hypothetical protein PIB30_090110 [Stylosanthes scabra]|uniref:Uncharacterized protein n=1 Tax=Stylosanthes scabra TaxID=79078 RepID=A0ABU6YTQ2_9FABA|nr:hypothetical protein [Stylosanthes scabra]